MIYYEYKERKIDTELENEIIEKFNQNHKIYGTRKLKKILDNPTSRRKIGRIMEKYSLISKYTLANFKVHKKSVNEEPIPNIVDRKFNDRKPLEVIVSDLTYVRVVSVWMYLCAIIDLNNREIVGYSAGKNKNAELVIKAFSRIKANLKQIDIFHTDRGSEFKNRAIDELVETFGIQRSLSKKGTPYDNAVSESTYHIIKTEFVKGEKFNSLEELEIKFSDFVNWYNNVRIHGSLDYLSPVTYRLKTTSRQP